MSLVNPDKTAEKVPYRAGTYSIGNGIDNLGLFNQIFGKIIPDIFGFNQKLIDFTLAYDGEITIRFNSPSNDPFILRNPAAQSVYLNINDLIGTAQIDIREVYVSNSSGSSVNIDVLLIAHS